MKFFSNLPIRHKLLLSFALITIFFAGSFIYMLMEIHSLQTTQKNLQELYFANAMDLSNFENNFYESRVHIRTILFTKGHSLQETYLERIKNLTQENDDILKDLIQRNQKDPAIIKKLQHIAEMREKMNKINHDEALPLIQKGKIEEATAIMIGPLTELFNNTRINLKELTKSFEERAAAAGERTQSRVAQMVTLFMVLAVVLVIFSMIMVALLNRAIATPLTKVTDVITNLARGDLEVRVPDIDTQDEVGALCLAAESMVSSLQKLTRAVEQVADGDLTVRVEPRSDKDILAISFGVMGENLRGLVMQIKQGADELISLSGDSQTINDKIIVDAGAIQQDIVELQDIVKEIRQHPGVGEVLADRWAQSEDLMAGVYQTCAQENQSAQEMKTNAQNLADLGGRLKFFVDRLRV